MKTRSMVAVAAVLALSSGCQGAVVPTPSATAALSGGDARAGAVALAVGQSVRLSLGQYNASVGDSWAVLNQEPKGVVTAEIRTVSLQADPAPGSPSDYYVDLTGSRSGSTTVELRYCYRSALAADCDQGPRSGAAYANVILAVTVS